MQAAFELIAMGKVSSSAYDAKKLKLLRATDRIVMNADRLLTEAKAVALQLADGYVAPAPRQVKVLAKKPCSKRKVGSPAPASS